MSREAKAQKLWALETSQKAQAKVRAALEAALDGVYFGVPNFHPWQKVMFSVGLYAPSGRPLLIAHDASPGAAQLFELTMHPPKAIEPMLGRAEWLLRPGAALASGILRTMMDARIVEPAGKTLEMDDGISIEVWRWTQWTLEQH